MIYQVNSPIDRTNKIKTIFLLSVIIVVVCIQFLSNNYLVGLIVLISMSLIAVIVYINIPRKIIVSETEIILVNMGFKRIISRNEIVKVRVMGDADRVGLWRKFGSDGLFGYYGIFSSRMHKTLYVYTSQERNWVLIETVKKKYVISPATTVELTDILKPQ